MERLYFFGDVYHKVFASAATTTANQLTVSQSHL
jgi:hypothetical protein